MNILTLQRYGATGRAEAFGLVDDLTFDYDGNQLTEVTESAEDPLVENSLDFRQYSAVASRAAGAIILPGIRDSLALGDSLIVRPGIDPVRPFIPVGTGSYSYDFNGNINRDVNSRIASVVYNDINLPRRVTHIADGVSPTVTDYVYDATGAKMRVSRGESVTEYYGDFIVEDGRIRVLTPFGYYDHTGAFHCYHADYQGNILAVSKGEVVEQRTFYYSDGLPMTLSTAPDLNPFKYSAKELDTYLSCPVYDFTARTTFPSRGNTFASPDPKATSYTWFSPYTFCAGDPVNYVDPKGQEIQMTIDGILYKYHKFRNSYTFVDENGNPYDGANAFALDVINALNKIQSGPIGSLGVSILINSKKVCTISELSANDNEGVRCQNMGNGDCNILWKAGSSVFTGLDGKRTQSFECGLVHEIGHSISYFLEINDESTWYTYKNSNGVEKSISKDDIFSCFFENCYRTESGQPLRTYYSGFEKTNLITKKSGIYPHPQSFVLSPFNILYDIIYKNLKKCNSLFR